MSSLNTLFSGVARYKKNKRKGRGESSGHGKTSGKGNKGSKARVGKYIRRGYEGGQTEVYRRFPKRGFSNADFETRFYIINVGDLAASFDDGSTVDSATLLERKLIPDTKQGVKILGNGEVGKKLTIHADWYSKQAAEKLTKAGGKALNVKGDPFEFPKAKKKFIPREPAKKKKVEDAEPAAEPKA